MAERTARWWSLRSAQHVEGGCDRSASGGTDFGLLKQHLAHRWLRNNEELEMAGCEEPGAWPSECPNCCQRWTIAPVRSEAMKRHIMRHSSSLRGNRCWSSQRPHVVQDPNLRYSVSKCHSPQRDEFCPRPPILYFKIHFNIILLRTPGPPKSSFFFRFPSPKSCVCISLRPRRSHLPHPTHSFLIWCHDICC